MSCGSNGTLSADCQNCPVLQATHGSSASFTQLCFSFTGRFFKWDVNFQRQPVAAAKHSLAGSQNRLCFGLSQHAKSRLFGLVAQLAYAALKQYLPWCRSRLSCSSCTALQNNRLCQDSSDCMRHQIGRSEKISVNTPLSADSAVQFNSCLLYDMSEYKTPLLM